MHIVKNMLFFIKKNGIKSMKFFFNNRIITSVI